MNTAEMREQLWGTVLAFDAIRQRLVSTCFMAEVKNFPQAKPSLRAFTEEMRRIVTRCEVILEGMEEPERI
jgi:hypothetical protein